MFTARTARSRAGGVRSTRPAIRANVETAASAVTGRPDAAWSARLCAVRCRITGNALTYLRDPRLRRIRRPSADVPRISAGPWRASSLRSPRDELRRERDQRAEEGLGLGLA